jgi:hypothetical protein
MPKYTAELHLHVSSSCEVEIEAANEDEAMEKADAMFDDRSDLDWDEQDVQSEVYGINLLSEEK